MNADWREAEYAAYEELKFAVGFKVNFDRGAQSAKLKAMCRIAKTTSDEIESAIEERQLLRAPIPPLTCVEIPALA